MEVVRTVLYLVLAVLFPVGAVVFAVRSQGRGAPSGRSWSVYLHGDGPPYPARSVNGRLVVGSRLMWVANSNAGQIDFTETGLHVIRLDRRGDDDRTLGLRGWNGHDPSVVDVGNPAGDPRPPAGPARTPDARTGQPTHGPRPSGARVRRRSRDRGGRRQPAGGWSRAPRYGAGRSVGLTRRRSQHRVLGGDARDHVRAHRPPTRRMW